MPHSHKSVCIGSSRELFMMADEADAEISSYESLEEKLNKSNEEVKTCTENIVRGVINELHRKRKRADIEIIQRHVVSYGISAEETEDIIHSMIENNIIEIQRKQRHGKITDSIRFLKQNNSQVTDDGEESHLESHLESYMESVDFTNKSIAGFNDESLADILKQISNDILQIKTKFDIFESMNALIGSLKGEILFLRDRMTEMGSFLRDFGESQRQAHSTITVQNCPHKDTKIISHYNDCMSSSDNDDDNTNRIVINSSVDEGLSGNYRRVNVNVIEKNKIDDQLKQVRKDHKNKFYNIVKSKNKSEDIEQLQQEHSWKLATTRD